MSNFREGDLVRLKHDYKSYGHDKIFPKGTKALVVSTKNLDAQFGYIIISIIDLETKKVVHEMGPETALEKVK